MMPLVVSMDPAAGWSEGLARARAAGADGLVVPADLLPTTDVLEVDALAADLDRPVVAVTAVADAGGTPQQETDRLVRMVRLAHQLGPGGVQLRLTVDDDDAATRRTVMADVVDPLEPLARALGVSVVLDDAPVPGWTLLQGNRI